MFWEVSMICPKCQEEARLVKCFYNAKGEFAFHAFCKTCQHVIVWEVLGEAMRYMASCADKKEKKESGNVEKQLPFLEEEFSDEDIKLLKGWNIKPKGVK